MSYETSESVATQAYIAYVHSKGYPPTKADHFIKFCKSHKPPFIGVNYKTAKQFIAQPPSISANIKTNDQPAADEIKNPYLDASLIQNNQDAIKSTNINDIYELHKQKHGIHPNNAIDFLSFCETNNFNITYSECSRFLSTKSKKIQGSRVRALSMISSTNNNMYSNKTRRERTKSVGRLNADSILHKMKQIQLDSDQQRLNELNQQKNMKKSEQIQTINAKEKIEKMIKETEEKNESQIEQIKCENQDIQQLNKTSTMIQKINENLKNKQLIQNISTNTPTTNQLEIEEKNYKNIQPESETKSTFLSEDKFRNNIINCTKSNGIELSDNFIHIDIDSNNPEQIKEAINVATTRAFHSRLVEPVNNITKGKLFGEMNMFLPYGLVNKHEFNGEDVYNATATFKQSDISQETFKSDMYYDEVSFNPIYKSTQNAKSSQTFFTETDTNISSTIDVNSCYNKLNDEIAVKLQQQHLSKMDESNKINKVYHSETIPSSEIFKISTTGPKESCRAHFTGLMIGGTYVHNHVSVAYKIDTCSEYVGQGEYPRNRDAFPKAVATTFDGIAIDHKTRVIIYEKENFQGNKLLDAKGPKIILNGIWKNDERVNVSHCKTDIFPDPELQKNFPIEVRMWTESNMHEWSYGSVKILSNLLNE